MSNALNLSPENFRRILRGVQPRITRASFWVAANAYLEEEGEFPMVYGLYDWPGPGGSCDPDLEDVTWGEIHHFLYGSGSEVTS